MADRVSIATALRCASLGIDATRDVLAAIGQATRWQPEPSAAACRALVKHLGYPETETPDRTLRRWAQARSQDDIKHELRAAAHGLVPYRGGPDIGDDAEAGYRDEQRDYDGGGA